MLRHPSFASTPVWAASFHYPMPQQPVGCVRDAVTAETRTHMSNAMQDEYQGWKTTHTGM